MMRYLDPGRFLLRWLGLGLAILFAPLTSAAAQAQDRPDRHILVGGGIQAIPRYPGAENLRIGFLPAVETWREDEPMPAESPDEGVGFALVGRRGETAAGTALTFAPQRSASDLPGLPEVGFGVELGGFVETFPIPALRLRGELRHGIGAHKALAGDISADFVLRGGERTVATLGPRLRWGSAKYNRAYFGIDGPVPPPGLTAYDPGAGFHSAGVNAGLHTPLGDRLGLYAYGGYDRLIGPASRSPIVATGSRDQFAAGLALTWLFTISR